MKEKHSQNQEMLIVKLVKYVKCSHSRRNQCKISFQTNLLNNNDRLATASLQLVIDSSTTNINYILNIHLTLLIPNYYSHPSLFCSLRWQNQYWIQPNPNYQNLKSKLETAYLKQINPTQNHEPKPSVFATPLITTHPKSTTPCDG